MATRKLFQILFDIEFTVGDEGVVPLLTIALDEGLFQELVDGQVQAPSFVTAALADVPAVVVQTDTAIAECLFTDRIECTADGFAEFAMALTEG